MFSSQGIEFEAWISISQVICHTRESLLTLVDGSLMSNSASIRSTRPPNSSLCGVHIMASFCKSNSNSKLTGTSGEVKASSIPRAEILGIERSLDVWVVSKKWSSCVREGEKAMAWWQVNEKRQLGFQKGVLQQAFYLCKEKAVIILSSLRSHSGTGNSSSRPGLFQSGGKAEWPGVWVEQRHSSQGQKHARMYGKFASKMYCADITG